MDIHTLLGLPTEELEKLSHEAKVAHLAQYFPFTRPRNTSTPITDMFDFAELERLAASATPAPQVERVVVEPPTL